MAKLRHIALAVPDPEKAAKFYSEVFDMKIVEPTESPIASGWYLTDGTICLALLNYKTDAAAGLDRGKNWVGTHHFGFWVDDLEPYLARAAKAGVQLARATVDCVARHYGYDDASDASCVRTAQMSDPEGNVIQLDQWVGASG